jgi:hypothetical protein
MSRRQREEESRELHKLESENTKLKKSVARLRKKLERYESAASDDEDDTESVKQVGIPSKDKCPECSSKEVVELDFAGRVFKLCKICKWRKLIKRVS